MGRSRRLIVSPEGAKLVRSVADSEGRVRGTWGQAGWAKHLNRSRPRPSKACAQGSADADILCGDPHPGSYLPHIERGQRVQMRRILVAWHQLYLVPFDVHAQFAGDGAGTLIAAATEPGHLIVRTGCATGPVHATLLPLTRPPRESPDGPVAGHARLWEAVEEVSLPVTEPLFWSSPDPGPDLPTAAAFTPHAAGPHRVRVSARGRLLAFDEALVEPVEEYLVQVWPEQRLRAPVVLLSDRAPF